MRSFLVYISAISGLLYLFSRCANMMPPGGGPRDSIPPVLVRSVPPIQSLNYKGNTVKLTFNEYLKINDLKKQLIITPIIGQEYETKIKKYTLELDFPEPFGDSTTYTFNFRNAIQDITEGNVTGDNVLAFSTGNYIDSIYITGKISFLLNGKPAKDYVVCLYRATDTLDIFNSPPMYLTKSNEEGGFRIENIKTGYYRMYAYADQNANLKCDIPREPFGFRTDTVNLYRNVDSTSLSVQYLDMNPLKLQRADPAGQYYEIKLNKNVVEYNLKAMDSSHTVYHNFAGDHKSIRVYDTFGKMDSLRAIFNARDSINRTITDTLYIKFTDSKRKKEPFTLSFIPRSDDKITDDFHGTFIFNKPVLSILPDSVYFRYDSTTYQYLNSDSLFITNRYLDRISFDANLHFSEYLDNLAKSDSLNPDQEAIPARPKDRKIVTGKTKKKNQLAFHIGYNSFISADQDTVKEVEYFYSLLDPENYGIIRGTVRSEKSSFTIELLDRQFNVMDTVQNRSAYEFRNVKPGDYTIRVFIDDNNNGRWDPGNIFENIPPERVYFFPGKISLRANWELTDIDLEF